MAKTFDDRSSGWRVHEGNVDRSVVDGGVDYTHANRSVAAMLNHNAPADARVTLINWDTGVRLRLTLEQSDAVREMLNTLHKRL